MLNFQHTKWLLKSPKVKCGVALYQQKKLASLGELFLRKILYVATCTKNSTLSVQCCSTTTHVRRYTVGHKAFHIACYRLLIPVFILLWREIRNVGGDHWKVYYTELFSPVWVEEEKKILWDWIWSIFW